MIRQIEKPRPSAKVANPGSRIRELWGVVAVDEDGDETLVFRNAFGHWYPLVTGDAHAIGLMESMGREMLKQFPHLKVEVRHFATDELCRVISVNRLASLGGLNGR
jgi:hypothetical protein